MEPPSDLKIKNLSKKIEEAHLAQIKEERKMDNLIKDYISDCLKRKDEKGLSNLVDKMPRSYFGKLYIYQAMGEIKEKSKLKTTKQTP